MIATPFNFNPEEDGPLPESMPIHTACGLPAELCVCPDSPVKFEDGRFIDRTKTIIDPEP